MTANLVQFLRDRLDEDEAVARGVTVPLDWHQGPGPEDPEWAGDEMVLMWPPEFHTPYEQDKHWRGLTADPAGLAAHIARHDPARVLREVEAKRGLLDAALADRHHVSADQYETCPRATAADGLDTSTLAALDDLNEERRGEDGVEPKCWDSCGRDARVHRTLELLALPYADHPDYQQEWRP